MNYISSVHNSKIRTLIGLKDRRQRLAAGQIVVEGYEEILLALESDHPSEDLFYCPALFPAHYDLRRLLDSFPPEQHYELEERVFHKIAYRENPDGCIATFPPPDRPLDQLPIGPNPLILVAEGVEKPGNLGAMLRTADAAGADALIACDPLTDWGNPNIVRASKGTLFTVPTSQANSESLLSWIQKRGLLTVVASPEAELSYTQADLSRPLALILGTEHEGVSDFWHAAADLKIRLPMYGKVNSLNVSNTAAILLYEVVRQRAR
jgi:TrmH family RNA methyltransferase